MVNIIFYSLMELLTAFSPSYTVFLIFRALYGVGMGGEWGLGASLAMESLPARARGLASGILQQGYSFGFLLAAVVYWLVFPHFGWRALFVVGALPALLVIYIRAHVPESAVWQRQRKTSADVVRHGSFYQGALAALSLRRAPDDRLQLHVARHAGSLPDISAKAARAFRQPDGADCDHLQSRRDLRWHAAWSFLAELGSTPHDHHRGGARDSAHPGLDLFAARSRS